MANRRMISREVVKKDHFLRLQPSAQGLYMHLVLDADDDVNRNPETRARPRFMGWKAREIGLKLG